jgi:hypothetical protein
MTDSVGRYGTLFGVVGTWSVALWEWLSLHGINDVTGICAVVSTLIGAFCAIPSAHASFVFLRTRIREWSKAAHAAIQARRRP